MKKRELTVEQIEARDAKRAKFRGLVKQVAAMDDKQRSALVDSCCAVVTCEGRALSLTNTMLAILQTGGKVSMVGELAQAEASGDSQRFGTATVFDISQTQDLDPAVATVETLNPAALVEAARETALLEGAA